MKIYRGIAINENERINSHLGVSWSLDIIFAENHAKSIASVRGKDGYVVLEAEIEEDSIEMNNTLFAMENRSKEYEVVLNHGTELVTYVEITTIESIKQYAKIEGVAVTENNFEDYCNSYEGELTSEDFLNLANEF